MAKTTAFSLLNTLLVVGLLAAIAATVYNRDAISNRLHNIRNGAAEVAVTTPTPTPTLAPTPTATPTPTPEATPDASSISRLNPSTTSSGDSSLPQSGPELNVLLAGATTALSGSGYYYYAAKKRLKKSLQDLDIQ